MFRNFILKNKKIGFILLSFLIICIFLNRDSNVVVQENIYSTQNLSGIFSSTSSSTKKAPMKDFSVFDHKCKIPRVDPFSADVMSIFMRPKYKECTKDTDLVTVLYDQKKREYILHVNETLPIELCPNITDFGCAYYDVTHGPNDSLTWVYFEQDWIVPGHIQAIIVQCHELGNQSRIIQSDAFSFVQYPGDRDEKNDRERSRTNPSVVMLGIDSMSQMNFQRTMPLTAKFVRQLGWYEMLGYNKIGDNTFPNMLVLLTGHTTRYWRRYCDVKIPGCLDTITYIWNHFHNAGYLTAYAEDTPSIDTFHYLMAGFSRQPVDYYLRPFLVAIESIMKKVKHFGYDYCVGRRQSFRYVFDYCLHLVQRFVKESPKPLFGIFWTNSFSHDDFSGAASVDGEFVNYLEQYKEAGLFDRAIVILFSDHGQRQGPLMELASSFMEERLPMLHIYLPTWYRQQYPEAVQALEVNRRRLSSTMDLHLTMKHLLQQMHPDMEFVSPCLKCQSLLMKLPVNRSCADAFIPEHWCTCQSYIQVPSSESMEYLGKLVVYRINTFLSSKNYDRKCFRLKLDKLLRAERKQNFDDDGNEAVPLHGIETYRLKFTTQPNGGLFRATITSDREANVKVDEDFITRLNSYRNDSFCVSESVVKKFCVCLKAHLKYLYDANANDQGTPS